MGLLLQRKRCYNKENLLFVGGDTVRIDILTEPAFAESSWCKAILSGLSKTLARKKIPYRTVTDIPLRDPTEQDPFLILIASNEAWVATVIRQCRDRKIHPILLSAAPQSPMPGVYSTVTSDMRQSMYYLLHYLMKQGKTKPALYGINPTSLPNLARKEHFLAFTGAEKEQDIYYNTGSLEECFESFLPHIDRYDCVISANDYAAISLIKNLEKHGITADRLLPVSYGGTRLATRYADRLQTISMCYDEYGKAAVSICETLSKNHALLYMNLSVKWKIGNSDNWAADLPDGPNTTALSASDKDEPFYRDGEVSKMLRIENMLSLCDATDQTILSMLLAGKPYEEISADCFLALNTVKYRLKKLMEACGAESKKQLIALLQEYY